MKHIKYPSTEQLRNVIREVARISQFSHLDGEGNAVYNSNPLPTVTFTGTVKLHGCNMGVTYYNNELYPQTRNNIISLNKDSFGIASFVFEREKQFRELFTKISELYPTTEPITIFGEFAGKGIQKGVGISLLPKSFYIFAIKVGEIWIEPLQIQYPEFRIFDLTTFKTYELIIDMNRPELSYQEIEDIVNEVETRCPVSATLLPNESNLIGEGVVFKAKLNDSTLLFKAKGEKHSKSKVKKSPTLTPEELEKLDLAHKCAEEIFSYQRCNQALTEIFGPNDEDIDIKQIGKYLKWVSTDTIKEESDIILNYGLEIKAVMPLITKKTKEYFFGILGK